MPNSLILSRVPLAIAMVVVSILLVRRPTYIIVMLIMFLYRKYKLQMYIYISLCNSLVMVSIRNRALKELSDLEDVAWFHDLSSGGVHTEQGLFPGFHLADGALLLARICTCTGTDVLLRERS
jgi:hypothetical protein